MFNPRIIDSDKWYKEAEVQTIETLPDFIAKVRAMFPTFQEGYGGVFPEDKQIRQSELYQNCMVAGVLITYAAFHAASNKYNFSCNQAGVVRSVVYQAIFDKKIDLNRL